MLKREVMTKREWRKHYAGMEKPPLAGVLIGTTAAYLVGGALFLLMVALW